MTNTLEMLEAILTGTAIDAKIRVINNTSQRSIVAHSNQGRAYNCGKNTEEYNYYHKIKNIYDF